MSLLVTTQERRSRPVAPGRDSELIPPIFVIGGTRSGTSMLCRVLAEVSGHCLWYEPAQIWRIGAAYRSDDATPASAARPWVRRRIRKLFLNYQNAHGGARVIEKTPYNVVRIPFLYELFPDATFVHIYRDGRANLRSQVEKFETFRAYNLRRARSRQVILERLAMLPFWEWPAYLPRAASGLMRSLAGDRSPRWWGVRYPGWSSDARRLSKAEIAAKQWVVSIETAMRDLEQLPQDQVMTVRYENLTRSPWVWFERITSFCGMTPDEDFFRFVEEVVHPDSIDRWRHELDPAVLDQAMPVMGPLLKKLGYTL